MDESSLDIYKHIRDAIKSEYDQEAESIAMLIVENLTGFSNTEILLGKNFKSTSQVSTKIDNYIKDLKDHTPVRAQ